MSRLHCITPWQGRKPSVLSEELLLAQKREEKTCVFVRHFLAQKMAERAGFEPAVGFDPYDGLANRSFRPLRHLSALSVDNGYNIQPFF